MLQNSLFINKSNVNLSENVKRAILSDVFHLAKAGLVGDGAKVVPMEIAKAGTFKGYRDGEFSLTKEMFLQAIDNFNKEANPIPVYRGHADVVGSITGEEPPAMGWILALKYDEQEGKLMALVELTQEMQTLVSEGKYKFTSIYMKQEDIDRVTGESIGARLCSLAITNSPFIDGLTPITLSQHQKQVSYNIYNSKEILNMATKSKKSSNNKKIVLASPDTESLQEAVGAEEQMDNMQKGRVMDPEKTLENDPMQMLQDAKDQISPDLTIEDFVKYLLTLAEAHEKEEETLEPVEEQEPGEEEEEVKETVEQVAAADTEQVVEDKQDSAVQEEAKAEGEPVEVEKKEKKKVMEMAASSTVALTSTIKALNLALSNAKQENEELKKELQKEKDLILGAVVQDAINKGKLLDTEKDAFIKLGSTNRALFDELLSARNHKPQVILSRLVNTHDEEKNLTNGAPKFSNISEHERKILEGAKVKISD